MLSLEIEAVHYSRQFVTALFAGTLFVHLLTTTPAAQALDERALPLDAKIDGAAGFVEFNWPRATGTRVEQTRIERRKLGETGKYSWQPLGTTRQIVRLYRDTDIRPGIAYEYRISRPSKEQVESGYWATGLHIPAEENHGVALVIVDETVAASLDTRLDRFALDLIGDGWTVVRHRVPRDSNKDPLGNLQNARSLRRWIQQQYAAAPGVQHAIILVGRVPVVRSGRAAPDGHQPRALETDLFYADLDGVWNDNGTGVLVHNVIPSDHIEMQIGRIDFSRLDGALGDEISLLQQYFDKNHHWRHGQLGDLREAYGNAPHLFVENAALRNIVGPERVASGKHHDTGTRQPWLFGVDFGSSQYTRYAEPTPIKAVFTINFGSGKLDFSRYNNEMIALLAQRWYTLTTGWGGRPAWQLHHMALGKSIGYSHLRTVNNGASSRGGQITLEYTSTGTYPWVNPVWVNLLGDPTLRPFPLTPVNNLRARAGDAGVQLEWDAAESPAGRQYRIYRAASRFGPYQALNPTELLAGNQFTDTRPIAGGWYMVRAHALKSVYAGSFYRYSQGRFATPANHPPRARDQVLSTPMGEALTLRLSASDADARDRLLLAPVKGPGNGQLVPSGTGWSFIPNAGFSGSVNFPFSVFDGIATDTGRVTIEVVQP